MFTYKGKIRDNIDVNGESFRHLWKVGFILQVQYSSKPVKLEFYVPDVKRCDDLKSFIKGDTNSLMIPGSHGEINMIRWPALSPDTRAEITLDLSYSDPVVNVSFSLGHPSILEPLLADLEKFPPHVLRQGEDEMW